MTSSLLPLELLNEPIAAVDNHYRPERKISRHRFAFCAPHNAKYSCRVCNSSFESLLSDSTEESLQKWTSEYSILNVYDTYGMDITLLFIQHVRTLSLQHSQKVAYYLRGSLHALQKVTGCGLSVGLVLQSDLCDSILEQLTLLDRAQPKAIEPITSAPDLPIEVLVLMINSVRVSKQLAREVQRHHAHQIPSLALFEGWKGGARFSVIGKMRTRISYCKEGWVLSYQDSGIHQLYPTTGSGESPQSLSGCRTLAYPIAHYEVELISRHCNPKLGIPILLRRLREPRSIEWVCALIVQLSSDLGVERARKQMLGDDGLKGELDRLLTLALTRTHASQ